MKRLVNITVALIALVFQAFGPAAAIGAQAVIFTHEYSLENGVSVRVYPPEEILGSLTYRDTAGRLIFSPAAGIEYRLIESVDDPLIVNKGDGIFHPMEEEAVVDALRAIDIGRPMAGLEIEIYILPLPRREILSSSAFRGRIFLSPGIYPWRVEPTACIVTHEVGHCFQHRYLPFTDTEGWSAYLGLRDILDDPAFTESAMHMYRPSEVFAEDFRALFGGIESRYSGTIENSDLAHPAEVDGLSDWIAGLAAVAVADATPGPDAPLNVSAWPNPFNPVTTISAVLGADDRPRPVEVSIFAADGSLVRRLYSGIAERREFSVTWDGRREGGGRAASGVYFYRIRSSGASATGKMLLIQ